MFLKVGSAGMMLQPSKREDTFLLEKVNGKSLDKASY